MTVDSTIVPTTLTEADAARLTTRIYLRLTTIADNTKVVVALIEEAWTGNAHDVLGYPSWTAYVTERFSGALARLDKPERLPLVEMLSGQSMSTRAIASVVGTSHQTVANDLAGSGVKKLTPDEPVNGTEDVVEKNTTITGLDGKTYPSAKVKAIREALAQPDETEAEESPDEWDGTYSTGYFDILEVGITRREAQAIEARWEFGQELLNMRDENGSLPDGYLAAVVKATGKSRNELRYRERLAQRYPTEEMLNAAIEKFGSWDAFIRGDLKREWYGGAR